MDQRTVRSYLFLASLKLSVCKDEVSERRWAERRAEREAQRAGKEPEFFDTGLDGRTLHGTRQELLQYWRNRAKELAAAQNPAASTHKPPQPVPPAPASRGSAPAPRPATYNLSEAEIERLRDDICIEAARNAKRSGWKRR